MNHGRPVGLRPGDGRHAPGHRPANVNQAKGTFDGPRQSYSIAANDQLLSSEEYKPLIVAYRNEPPFTSRDVANVIDDAENVKQAAWMNDRPSVILNVQRQPGANTSSGWSSTGEGASSATARVAPPAYPGARPDRPNDHGPRLGSGRRVRAPVAIALVVMVIFLFLRTLAATVIPSVAVPLSLVGTFGVMYLFGYSLNNLT